MSISRPTTLVVLSSTKSKGANVGSVATGTTSFANAFEQNNIDEAKTVVSNFVFILINDSKRKIFGSR